MQTDQPDGRVESINENFIRFLVIFLAMILAVVAYWTKPIISLGFDPEAQRCLPNLHLALMIHTQPDAVADGDLLFWKPSGPLSGFKEDFILKMVAGRPGDLLLEKDGQVFINGKLIVSGLPLARSYSKRPSQFDRAERIPPGKYFMVGVHPLSNDSRYWGYLSASDIAGFAYRVF